MSAGGPDRPVGGLAVRPPPGVELRPAAREDLDSVLALLAERTSVEAPELNVQTAAERWEAFMSSIDSSPFLAIAEGEAAGLLLLSFRRRLNFATWEGWVPELVVADDHRRRGVGRALLRVAIEEWRLRGAHRLSVEVAPGEEAGRALLSGMGFEERFQRFSLEPIPTASEPPTTPASSATLRDLRDDDFGAASRLVAEMGAHRSPLPDRMDAVERAYREIVRRPSNASLIAERSGAAIGICTVEIRTTLRREAPETWIPELVVSERFRGQGIGRALLERALNAARERGAERAVLESGAQRATAQALYRSVGFEEAGSAFTLLRDR
jgi:ribosomal protein S18 acetylase RimI-like enzyme